jgi:ornithine cyclodeaminase/alanine dehydrogenase-like protein (mu-crystallin family)
LDTLLLSADDMRVLVDKIGRDRIMHRVINRLTEDLCRIFRREAFLSPPRAGFTREIPVPGVLEWMPHHRPGDSATIKIVSYSPANPVQFSLPTVQATIVRIDDRTGRMSVLADGLLATAIRTGAASAVASRVLAAPDSSVVGVVGTGVQAITQLHALSLLFPVTRVLVWDVVPEHLASFATRASFLKLDIKAARPEDILRQADIVCTATSVEVGTGPVVPNHGWKDHLHINAVGADLAGKTELPRRLLRRALVCPDHREQAMLEGECQQLRADEVGPSLDELCARPESFREAANRLTVFDSTGFALEDHSALDIFVEAAIELGVGIEVPFECHPEDPLDPYSRHRSDIFGRI